MWFWFLQSKGGGGEEIQVDYFIYIQIVNNLIIEKVSGFFE